MNNKSSNFNQISVTVAELRAVALGHLRHEGAIVALAATASALLAGVALFAFAPPLLWLRLLVLAAWLTSVAGLTWWRAARPMRRYRDLGAVAHLIERGFPELRNDVSASLQFAAELDTLRQSEQVSVAMVERLLEQTEAALGRLRPRLTEALPQPRLGLPYGVAVVALAALLGVGLIAPDAFKRGLQGLAFGPRPPATSDEARRVALIGDINLTFRYPDYTGLGERTIQNSTGDIEVLRGAEIQFEAVALEPVNKAELVITLEDSPDEADPDAKDAKDAKEKGPQRVLLQRRTGERLVASFPALRSGTYTIEAELASGAMARDNITRTIRVIPDASPEVKVSSPEGEVDVSPQDVVTFVYKASDDFGLTEVAIVTAFEGADGERKRVVIKTTGGTADILPGDERPSGEEGAGPELSMSGEHLLDLAPFELRPRDRLVVTIEAVDNDTTAGPKVASSAPIVLRISSPEDKHLEIIDAQEKIFEALLDVLADYLEKAIGASWQDPRGDTRKGIPPDWTAATLTEKHDLALPPHKKKAEILTAMQSLSERMEQDPLMLKRDFELFERTRGELSEKHGAEASLFEVMAPAAAGQALSVPQLARLYALREETVHTTERAIISLEDLIASQRMENALETAKDLKEAVERLKELMKKYKETQDPALKAEIMREMQRLRQQMQELMAKMSSQIKDLPQEHVNMEALDREGMMNKASDASKSMEDIMKALEAGDIDKAMEMLSEMSQSVDDMLAQMEKEFDEMQPEGLSELDKRVSEIMDELNNLGAQEQELAKKTEELNQAMEAAQKERAEKMIDDFVQKELSKVQELRRRLEGVDAEKIDPMDRSAVERVKDQARRLEEALKQKDMAEALDQANELEQSMKGAETSLDFRARFMPDNGERKAYRDAQQGVRRSRPQAEEIARDLRELMEQARPRPDAGQSQQMSEMAQQQQQIKERAGKLREQLSQDGQFPMLQEKLGPGLQEAEQFMEGAGERLKRQEGRPAHENEKLAMDKLQGLKESLKKTLKEEKMGGQGKKRVSNEKVEIPDKDRRAPKEFREDIMDAMKEGGIDQYEDELQQYYESLVR